MIIIIIRIIIIIYIYIYPQLLKIQTHKRFKGTLIYHDIDNMIQIFRQIPFSGHKMTLKVNNNETVKINKNNEK